MENTQEARVAYSVSSQDRTLESNASDGPELCSLWTEDSTG